MTHIKEVIRQCDDINAFHLAIGHIIKEELILTVAWSSKCLTYNVLGLEVFHDKAGLSMDGWAAQLAKLGIACIVAVAYPG